MAKQSHSCHKKKEKKSVRSKRENNIKTLGSIYGFKQEELMLADIVNLSQVTLEAMFDNIGLPGLNKDADITMHSIYYRMAKYILNTAIIS